MAFYKITTSTIKKHLPEKSTLYTFIFNAILLSVTILFGNYYFPKKIQEYNNNKIDYQNYIEERNKFIKDFALLGQERVYNAERYYKNLNEKIENKEEKKLILEKSWNDYSTSVKNWNKENVSNSIFLSYYFDEKLKDEYNKTLLVKFSKLNDAVFLLKQNKKVDNFDQILESAKNEFYVFNEKMLYFKK